MADRKKRPKSEAFTLRVPARIENLHIIRYVVLNAADYFGFSKEDAAKVEIATDEACTNVIRHGYMERKGKKGDDLLYICLSFEADKMVIEIVDRAKPFSPLGHPPPTIENYAKDCGKGGLGIYIMKSLMDEITHAYTGEGNRLQLVKFLPRARSGGARSSGKKA